VPFRPRILTKGSHRGLYLNKRNKRNSFDEF
jgi:hypothetical protein